MTGEEVRSNKGFAEPFHSEPAELIVLTEWEINAPPPRLIFAVAEDHHSSYAAVAVQTGWLIVQI